MNRRQFLLRTTAALPAAPLALAEHHAKEPRFEFGIQQYTFRNPLRSGKLDVLDYPLHCKRELGISNIEYWSGGLKKHREKGFNAELTKRSVGEGLRNILILVDLKPKIDATQAAERKKSFEAHKPWVDTAAELGCESIRINVNAGGNPEENHKNALAGLPPLLHYAQKNGVRILLENHGGNSGNGAWVARLMKTADHPAFGTLPDFGNFRDYDHYKGISEMIPWAGTVCAKSHGFKSDGTEKHIDYHRMMKIVAASEYRGVISVEYEGSDLTPEEGSRKTRNLLLRAATAAGERFV